VPHARAAFNVTVKATMRIELIGFLAAACTTGSFIPQVVLVWRQRGAPGLSVGMYLMFITGVALWLAYGLFTADWPLALANGITLVLAVSVLAMKFHFERRLPPSRP
jgi:MtN3 and saliva related transmembrane protein